MNALKRVRKSVLFSLVGVGALLMGAFQNCQPYKAAAWVRPMAVALFVDQSVGPFAREPTADPAPVAMRRLTKDRIYHMAFKFCCRSKPPLINPRFCRRLQPFLDALLADAGAKFARTDSSIDQQHLSAYFYVADKLGELLTANDTRAKAFFGTCGGMADLSSSVAGHLSGRLCYESLSPVR